MASNLITIVICCLVGWLSWKVLRWFTVRSPLDDIPGPESHSFLTGKLFGMVEIMTGHNSYLRCNGQAVQ